MLTLSVLFAFSQQYCKTPEAKDVTSTLFDVGISALAASIAGLWRTLRSLIRIYHSVGVRIKSKNCCLRICLPKKSGDVVYPPNSRVQWCIFPFFVGLMMQLVAIIVASGTAWFIWNSYVQLKTLTNFDDTLGIYRSESGRRLFDISGTIIPPNGSFFDLEMIPRSELEARDADVFCLSEFEYRSEDHQIYFNVVQLFVVSNDGRFCRTSAALDNTPNNCTSFYSSIYYASANPHTGMVEGGEGKGGERRGGRGGKGRGGGKRGQGEGGREGRRGEGKGGEGRERGREGEGGREGRRRGEGRGGEERGREGRGGRGGKGRGGGKGGQGERGREGRGRGEGRGGEERGREGRGGRGGKGRGREGRGGKGEGRGGRREGRGGWRGEGRGGGREE